MPSQTGTATARSKTSSIPPGKPRATFQFSKDHQLILAALRKRNSSAGQKQARAQALKLSAQAARLRGKQGESLKLDTDSPWHSNPASLPVEISEEATQFLRHLVQDNPRAVLRFLSTNAKGGNLVLVKRATNEKADLTAGEKIGVFVKEFVSPFPGGTSSLSTTGNAGGRAAQPLTEGSIGTARFGVRIHLANRELQVKFVRPCTLWALGSARLPNQGEVLNRLRNSRLALTLGLSERMRKTLEAENE